MTAGAPPSLRAMVMENLHVEPAEVVEVDRMLGVSDLKELVLDSRPDLLWPALVLAELRRQRPLQQLRPVPGPAR